MKYDLNLPILLIGYNRADLFQKRLEEIKKLPLKKLYIALDSTNNGPNEKIIKAIDCLVNSKQPFETNVEIQSRNLGLTLHVTGAISKVLEEETSVLVIEDDISLSVESYLAFQQGQSLIKEKKHSGLVSGFSPISRPNLIGTNRWRRTKYFAVWGWIATRLTWEVYRYDLGGIDIRGSLSDSESWNTLTDFQKKVWISRFERVKLTPLHTWDTQMQFWSFVHEFNNYVPLFRLVENEGFSDPRAVHTKSSKPWWYVGSESDFKIVPDKVMGQFSTSILNFIDSATYIGDSKVSHLWAHKVKKKLQRSS